MPLVISLPPDGKSIELSEFLDVIQSKNYDFNNQDDLIDSAQFLNQLNNNKRFLFEQIALELQDVGNFQKQNKNGPQAFMIHKQKEYFLRAVVWMPMAQADETTKFTYDIYHDHNFDLLTAGYFGPGYKTKCFSYEAAKATGLLEESVIIEDQGMFTLAEGTILLYKAKCDIHTQLPPESMSVSLNLIPNTNPTRLPQFQFDVVDGRICKYIQVSSNELIVRLAGFLGDENSIDLLNSIVMGNHNEHIKAYAAMSVTQICPSMSQEIENMVNSHNNKLLIDIFEREKNIYGSCL